MKTTYFLINVLISLCIITSCQQNKKQVDGHGLQGNNIEISKRVINSFQKKEYSKIIEPFDQTMKDALTIEKLKSVWEELNLTYGNYQNFSDESVDKIENFDVVYILCHFEKTNLKMKTVFNSKSEIAGLFFIPENQK